MTLRTSSADFREMWAVPTRYTSEPLLRSLRYDIVSGTGDVAALSARRPKARHAARVAVAAIAARCEVPRSSSMGSEKNPNAANNATF
jgi:hypothetical protein